jgi:hypothetical protein
MAFSTINLSIPKKNAGLAGSKLLAKMATAETYRLLYNMEETMPQLPGCRRHRSWQGDRSLRDNFRVARHPGTTVADRSAYAITGTPGIET